MRKVPVRILESNRTGWEPSYLDSVLAAGTRDGNMIELSDEQYRDLGAKFRRPNLAAMATSAAVAGAMWAAAGFPTVTPEQETARRAVCWTCEFWNPAGLSGLGNCKICGCGTIKHWLATEQCPTQQWPEITL